MDLLITFTKGQATHSQQPISCQYILRESQEHDYHNRNHTARAPAVCLFRGAWLQPTMHCNAGGQIALWMTCSRFPFLLLPNIHQVLGFHKLFPIPLWGIDILALLDLPLTCDLGCHLREGGLILMHLDSEVLKAVELV